AAPRELPQADDPNADRPGPQMPKWVDYHARSTPCCLTLRLPSGPMKNPNNGCGDLSKMPPARCAHRWSLSVVSPSSIAMVPCPMNKTSAPPWTVLNLKQSG